MQRDLKSKQLKRRRPTNALVPQPGRRGRSACPAWWIKHLLFLEHGGNKMRIRRAEYAKQNRLSRWPDERRFFR